MDARVFVSRETDVTNFAGLSSSNKSGIGSIGIENAVRIFVAENFVVLDQVNLVHTEPLQRFIQLPCGGLFRAAVNFGHQESLRAIPVAQRFSHPVLAGAIVVVPTVVEKIDSPVDGAPANTDGY